MVTYVCANMTHQDIALVAQLVPVVGGEPGRVIVVLSGVACDAHLKGSVLDVLQVLLVSLGRLILLKWEEGLFDSLHNYRKWLFFFKNWQLSILFVKNCPISTLK